MLCARADRPAHRRGLSGPRTVRPQGRTVRRSIWCPTYAPLSIGGAEQTKRNLLDVITSVLLGILPHTRVVLFEKTPIQSLG
jgi:hypothetical protein